MSLRTHEAGLQEECVHREAGLFLPHVNSLFFLAKDQKVSAAWSSSFFALCCGQRCHSWARRQLMGLLYQAGTDGILL